jgi:hypothetical protein
MGDRLEKAEAKAKKEADKLAKAAERSRVAEAKLRKAQKARKHAQAVRLGYAMLDEMDDKPGINSMVREIMDRRLTVNRERSLFDLKPLAEETKAEPQKIEVPTMKLVKDDAAA